MEKIKNKLKECCLTCENFDASGIKGLGYSLACCAEPERVIACGHMEVCWKYNEKNLDGQTPKKPVNAKKNGKQIRSADCPSCGQRFMDLGGIRGLDRYTFCTHCGQKIDWGEA